MNARRYLIPLVLTVVASPILPAPPAHADDRARQWGEKLQETERLLEAGDYDKARRITVKITEQMVDEMGPGENAAKALGAVLTLRALAEAGLRNEADALWYWHLALNFFPELATREFERYGAAGELLRDHPLSKRSPDDRCPGPPAPTWDCCPDCGDRVIAPRVRRKPQPKYAAGARAFGQEGTLEVLVAVSLDGAVSHPRIVRALPAPTLSFTTLEAVRQWEFEPARFDGEPIPYYYRLTVNFDLRH